MKSEGTMAKLLVQMDMETYQEHLAVRRKGHVALYVGLNNTLFVTLNLPFSFGKSGRKRGD
jgi:hypothetical protein